MRVATCPPRQERLCCTAEDCGAGATCLKLSNSLVGTCKSYNGTIYVPLCSGIPAVGPSGGSCVP